MVLQILDKIYDLKRLGFEIIFLWAPSHCGIQGNEQADTIASNDNIESKHLNKFPLFVNEIKPELNKTVKER